MSYFFLFSFFLFGLVVGSFLNVCIYRLPIIFQNIWQTQNNKPSDKRKIKKEHITLAYPASFCPMCFHKLKVWQNIPIISFVLQKGKCKFCKNAISYQYPLVEILTAILFVIAYLRFSFDFELFFILAFISFLIVIAIIDWQTFFIFDTVVLLLLWCGLFYNAIFDGFVLPQDAIVGAIVGYLSLYLLFWIFKIIRKKEGLGYGDFKLLSAIGAWFGWQSLSFIVLASSLFAIFGGIIIKKNVSLNIKIPFAPFLSSAALLYLFFNSL
jgi:leader peptidase (prepilin peptidase) / N-methyltransferase